MIDLDTEDTMARLAAHSFMLAVVLGSALKGMPTRERAEFARAMQDLARTADPGTALPPETAEAVRRVMDFRANVVGEIFDRAEAIAAEGDRPSKGTRGRLKWRI